MHARSLFSDDKYPQYLRRRLRCVCLPRGNTYSCIFVNILIWSTKQPGHLSSKFFIGAYLVKKVPEPCRTVCFSRTQTRHEVTYVRMYIPPNCSTKLMVGKNVEFIREFRNLNRHAAVRRNQHTGRTHNTHPALPTLVKMRFIFRYLHICTYVCLETRK